MRHRKHTFKIGRSDAHRKALLANQVCSLVLNGEIRTTIVKAKETKRLAEKMVTLGKRGGLHCRRQAIAKLRDPEAVKTIFDTIAVKFASRAGGYTRIIRLGQRVGDAAEICILQWVEQTKAPKKPRAEKPAEAVKDAAPAATTPAAV